MAGEAGGKPAWATWFDAEAPNLLTNRTVRNYLSGHNPEHWPEVVKLTLLHGIHALQQQYGTTPLSIPKLKDVVGKGHVAVTLEQTMPQLERHIEQLASELSLFKTEMTGAQVPTGQEALSMALQEAADGGGRAQAQAPATPPRAAGRQPPPPPPRQAAAPATTPARGSASRPTAKQAAASAASRVRPASAPQHRHVAVAKAAVVDAATDPNAPHMLKPSHEWREGDDGHLAPPPRHAGGLGRPPRPDAPDVGIYPGWWPREDHAVPPAPKPAPAPRAPPRLAYSVPREEEAPPPAYKDDLATSRYLGVPSSGYGPRGARTVAWEVPARAGDYGMEWREGDLSATAPAAVGDTDTGLPASTTPPPAPAAPPAAALLVGERGPRGGVQEAWADKKEAGMTSAPGANKRKGPARAPRPSVKERLEAEAAYRTQVRESRERAAAESLRRRAAPARRARPATAPPARWARHQDPDGAGLVGTHPAPAPPRPLAVAEDFLHDPWMEKFMPRLEGEGEGVAINRLGLGAASPSGAAAPGSTAAWDLAAAEAAAAVDAPAAAASLSAAAVAGAAAEEEREGVDEDASNSSDESAPPSPPPAHAPPRPADRASELGPFAGGEEGGPRGPRPSTPPGPRPTQWVGDYGRLSPSSSQGGGSPGAERAAPRARHGWIGDYGRLSRSPSPAPSPGGRQEPAQRGGAARGYPSAWAESYGRLSEEEEFAPAPPVGALSGGGLELGLGAYQRASDGGAGFYSASSSPEGFVPDPPPPEVERMFAAGATWPGGAPLEVERMVGGGEGAGEAIRTGPDELVGVSSALGAWPPPLSEGASTSAPAATPPPAGAGGASQHGGGARVGGSPSDDSEGAGPAEASSAAPTPAGRWPQGAPQGTPNWDTAGDGADWDWGEILGSLESTPEKGEA